MRVICPYTGEWLTWASCSVPLIGSPVPFPQSDYVICLIATGEKCPNTKGIHTVWAHFCKPGLVNIYVPNLWFGVVNKCHMSQ